MKDAKVAARTFPTRLSTIAGLVLSPFVGGTFGFLVFLLLLYASVGNFPGGDLSDLLKIAVQSGGISVGVTGAIPTLIVGLLAHSALLRFRATHLYVYVLAGAGLTLAFFFALMLFFGFVAAFVQGTVLLAFATGGAAAAATFWLIRRPDLDARISEPVK